ncbi:hypothetical protein TrRE_jg9771 [Triparma retinervis]|uniref:TauD/TfdA-like domain-containing protein n=1 Tax=Triparma retinervis TaxID=2557542 RepID=A0A9W7FVZ9_9STRA|nr:hypothetical protein TrRE_jg9771 [Triparma retinervis]
MGRSPPPPLSLTPSYISNLEQTSSLGGTPSSGTYSPPPLVHWGSSLDLRSPPVSFRYSDIVSSPSCNDRALVQLYKHGILRVHGAPTDREGQWELAECFSGGGKDKREERDRSIYHSNSGPMKTLYGSTWSTSTTSTLQGASTSVADSAYTSDSLPLHTDMTYFHSPPGLQIFTMDTPAPNSGGSSVYRDGFHAALTLWEEDPQAFSILSSTNFTYRYLDEDQGWHLEASGPIIDVDTTRVNPDGKPVLKGVRHNDLDRIGFLPPLHPPSPPPEFYAEVDRALSKWDAAVHGPGRVRVHLREGEAVIVNNNRVMHARERFTLKGGERSVVGCYVSREDIESRWRYAMTTK